MSKRRREDSPGWQHSGEELPDVQAACHGEVGNRSAPGEDEVVFARERHVVEASQDGFDSDIEVLEPPNLEPVPEAARPVAGAGGVIGESSVVRDNLVTVVRNLENELNKLPGPLARDKEGAAEDRQARGEVQCVERGEDEEWWGCRCKNVSKRYFAELRVKEHLTCKLEAAQKLLSQHQEALLDGTGDRFFPDRFKALYAWRRKLVKGNKGQREAGGELLLLGLLKAEIRTLTNRAESLRIRALQLEVASFTRRHELATTEVQRLKARLDGLTGHPNPDDDGLDVFEVSDDHNTSNEVEASSYEDDSDGTELEDERNTSRDTLGGQVPGDYPDTPSTSRGSPKAKYSA